MGWKVQGAQLTSRDLLLTFLDLLRLLPELNDWTEKRLAGNPPLLFRLQQLLALFKTFGIPWDPAAFVEGAFIRPEDPRYDSILSRLKAEIAEGTTPETWDSRLQLPAFFSILFDYRKRIDDLFSFSSGVLEASGLYLLAHLKAETQNQMIRDNLATIDDTLAELISPERAVFSQEQLVRDFGYPDTYVPDWDED
jgi:hypothetical protein